MNSLEQAVEIMLNSESLVFFGGAGVSTESGIPDFRSASGIYHRNYHVSPEEVVSHSFFMAYPETFYEFYRKYLVYPDAKPNVTHIALAKLEEAGHLAAIVTQNIDGLHQMAGSQHVVELHGSVLRNHCMRCGKKYDVSAVMSADAIPHCECGGTIKPDVVLYEEGLDENDINEAIRVISHADTLVVAGTSLVVYPAAGLIHYFRGKNIILINKTPTSADELANVVIHDNMSHVFAKVLEKLQENQ